MRAIITLLVALDNDLKARQRPTESCSLTFSLLTSMCYVSRCLRLVRKYLRLQIMPPLREVKSRPEESSTLKGRLVKLMTDVDVNIKVWNLFICFVLGWCQWHMQGEEWGGLHEPLFKWSPLLFLQKSISSKVFRGAWPLKMLLGNAHDHPNL